MKYNNQDNNDDTQPQFLFAFYMYLTQCTDIHTYKYWGVFVFVITLLFNVKNEQGLCSSMHKHELIKCCWVGMVYLDCRLVPFHSSIEQNNIHFNL